VEILKAFKEKFRAYWLSPNYYQDIRKALQGTGNTYKYTSTDLALCVQSSKNKKRKGNGITGRNLAIIARYPERWSIGIGKVKGLDQRSACGGHYLAKKKAEGTHRADKMWNHQYNIQGTAISVIEGKRGQVPFEK